MYITVGELPKILLPQAGRTAKAKAKVLIFVQSFAMSTVESISIILSVIPIDAPNHVAIKIRTFQPLFDPGPSVQLRCTYGPA